MSHSPIEWIRRTPILLILATNLLILLNIIRILMTQGSRCISVKWIEIEPEILHVTEGAQR